MDVADDALAGGYGPCKLVRNRMSRFVVRDRRIVAERRAAVAELSVRSGMHRRAVVGVDHVAGGAAAGAVIAGVIVGSEEIQGRIEQPRAEQADVDRIGSVLGA